MKAYDEKDLSTKPVRRGPSEDLLRVAVTFNRPGEQIGPTKFGARMSTDTITSFRPEPAQADLAIAELARHGFILTGRGELSASMRCTKTAFEKLFKTKLERMAVPGGSAAQMSSVLFPPEGAPWDPDPAVQALLDDVYIQWPHLHG